MTRRRVVTGEDEAGNPAFVSDEELEEIAPALLPGMSSVRVWADTTSAAIPNEASPSFSGRAFPLPGEFSFGFVTMAPEGSTSVPDDFDLGAALEEVTEKLPGFIEVFDPADPGMHASDTIDCGMVVSGSPILELPGGDARQLMPGDTYVVHGTRHRWIVPGPESAVLVAVAIGATRSQLH